MKVYLAARYGRHPEMRKVRGDLEALGHSVTSRWINGTHEMIEFGIGLTLGMDLIVVGPREHVFHHLTTVQHFEDWPSAWETLRDEALEVGVS